MHILISLELRKISANRFASFFRTLDSLVSLSTLFWMQFNAIQVSRTIWRHLVQFQTKQYIRSVNKPFKRYGKSKMFKKSVVVFSNLRYRMKESMNNHASIRRHRTLWETDRQYWNLQICLIIFTRHRQAKTSVFNRKQCAVSISLKCVLLLISCFWCIDFRATTFMFFPTSDNKADVWMLNLYLKSVI